MKRTTMLLATVSGSFHRHMTAIAEAVAELTASGVHVLSPADPQVVDAHGEFFFVASDRTRSVRMVQDRHLESLRASNFLWLVCPDGYVGQSASMELGYAVAHDVPVYSTSLPTDLTLRQYVRRVPSLTAAVAACVREQRQSPTPGFLIQPHASIAEAHDILEQMSQLLTRRPAAVTDLVAAEVYREKQRLHDLLGPHP